MKEDKAMGNSGYARVDHDFYPTPRWITEIIATYLGQHFDVERILEPSCGNGAMSEVLIEKGYKVDSYDLIDRGYGMHGINFLTHNYDMDKYDSIVTNPPYGEMAAKFIERALQLIEGKRGKSVVMVLRNEYDCAKNRNKLFGGNDLFHGKVSLLKRPLWIEPKPGEKAGSPRHNYSIFSWSSDRQFIPFGGTPPLPSIQYAHPDI